MNAEDLSRLPLFQGLSAGQLSALASLSWRERLSPGEFVFVQGDTADNIYVVEQGNVIIRYFPFDGGSLDIETITPGGVFGWSAALGRPFYTSAAVCLTEVHVIAARGSELRRALWADTELGAVLMDRMVQVVAHRLDSFRTQLMKLIQEESGS